MHALENVGQYYRVCIRVVHVCFKDCEPCLNTYVAITVYAVNKFYLSTTFFIASYILVAASKACLAVLLKYFSPGTVSVT